MKSRIFERSVLTKGLHNMDFSLSVLDVSPVSSGSDDAQALRNTLELIRLADGLGYERYWLAELHNLPTIASSPRLKS